MSKHFAELEVRCPQCGLMARRTFTAESMAYEFRLSAGTRCSKCLFAEEADGAELTDDARAAFYAREGRWSLVIDELGVDRIGMLQKLRAFLGNTPNEMLKLINDRRPIIIGALVEIEQLSIPLTAIDAKFSVSEMPLQPTESSQ